MDKARGEWKGGIKRQKCEGNAENRVVESSPGSGPHSWRRLCAEEKQQPMQTSPLARSLARSLFSLSLYLSIYLFTSLEIFKHSCLLFGRPLQRLQPQLQLVFHSVQSVKSSNLFNLHLFPFILFYVSIHFLFHNLIIICIWVGFGYYPVRSSPGIFTFGPTH